MDVDINELLPKKTHPLFNDWKLRCEDKITIKELDVRIALNVFSTIDDYKYQVSPPPVTSKEIKDLTESEYENYIFWHDEKTRRWAKNKSNLQFLIEQKKILMDNGFENEAAGIELYIQNIRENGIKTFKEHTCSVCNNNFIEE